MVRKGREGGKEGGEGLVLFCGVGVPGRLLRGFRKFLGGVRRF